MKRTLFALFAALLIGFSASAQRLMFGVRGGVNFTDLDMGPVRLGDVTFTAGAPRAGYEAGIVLRLNLSRHLHLQTELNYVFANYHFKASGNSVSSLVLRTERLQIPVELGFQFGVVRLFGGVQFRVADTQHSSTADLLRVNFNDRDLALLGGVGINIRKFFLDFRVTGYPRSHVWQTFHSFDASRRVKVAHDIIYGGSLGFYF